MDLHPSSYWNDPAITAAMQNIWSDSTEQDRLAVQNVHNIMSNTVRASPDFFMSKWRSMTEWLGKYSAREHRRLQKAFEDRQWPNPMLQYFAAMLVAAHWERRDFSAIEVIEDEEDDMWLKLTISDAERSGVKRHLITDHLYRWPERWHLMHASTSMGNFGILTLGHVLPMSAIGEYRFQGLFALGHQAQHDPATQQSEQISVLSKVNMLGKNRSDIVMGLTIKSDKLKRSHGGAAQAQHDIWKNSSQMIALGKRVCCANYRHCHLETMFMKIQGIPPASWSAKQPFNFDH